MLCYPAHNARVTIYTVHIYIWLHSFIACFHYNCCSSIEAILPVNILDASISYTDAVLFDISMVFMSASGFKLYILIFKYE